jgi:hypothetical protein
MMTLNDDDDDDVHLIKITTRKKYSWLGIGTLNGGL